MIIHLQDHSVQVLLFDIVNLLYDLLDHAIGT
jgi:hypothetical protein